MEGDTQTEVDKYNDDGGLELVDEDADQPGLEDVRVEEEQKDNDGCEQDADVLDDKQNKQNNILKS